MTDELLFQSKTSFVGRKKNNCSISELIFMPGAMLNNGHKISYLVFTPVLGVNDYYVLYRRTNWSSQSLYNVPVVTQLVRGCSFLFPKPMFLTTMSHGLSTSFFSNAGKLDFSLLDVYWVHSVCQELRLARGLKLCILSSMVQVIYYCQKLDALWGGKLIKFHVTITPSNSYVLLLFFCHF